MNVTQHTLDHLEAHWAVTAIPLAERARAEKLAEVRLVQKTVGYQLNLVVAASAVEQDLLRRVALAYEMAAIEGLPAFLSQNHEQDALRTQCAAGAWRAFAFRRLLPMPTGTADRLFHVLHLASLAYCGDRWSDIRRWFIENAAAVEVPSVADQPWDLRLLYRLFACWVSLLRKEGWDDLDRIREIVAGLREDQRQFERASLDSGSNSQDRAMALRLVAFYNWARATELLGSYMLQGEPRGIHALLDKHFEAATEAGTVSGDASLEMLMRWLHAAARQMVAGSLWWVAHAINSRVTRFIGSATRHQALFELLPPQRAALQEQGLLDAAATGGRKRGQAVHLALSPDYTPRPLGGTDGVICELSTESHFRAWPSIPCPVASLTRGRRRGSWPSIRSLATGRILTAKTARDTL